MKRFHVHLSVEDLNENVRFYSKVFGSEPAVLEPDYAKWMVEDPRINFAISTHRTQTGVNHLGIQVDTGDELKAMRDQLAAADAGLEEETGANCCYAKADKYWITDPQGIAWETYHNLGSIPVFGSATHMDMQAPTSVGQDGQTNEPAAVGHAAATTATKRIIAISAPKDCCS
jgi:catechol 2,3-dioxygenase-like lactoylglutathione lyase family enzyme